MILMGKIVSRMQNSSLWAGFRQWQKQTIAARNGWVKNKEKGDEQQRKKKKLQLYLLKWSRNNLTTLFKQWRSFARKNKLRKKKNY